MRRSIFAGLIAALIGSTLLWADGINIPFSFPASTCTNQFIRSIAASTGVGTCASVSLTADISGVLAVANGGVGSAPVYAGSWTPADNSGASLTFVAVSASYNKIGNMVWVGAQFTYPSTASGAGASISGLPVTVGAANSNRGSCSIVTTAVGLSVDLLTTPSATTATFNNAVAGTALTNAQMSGAVVIMGCWYAAS